MKIVLTFGPQKDLGKPQSFADYTLRIIGNDNIIEIQKKMRYYKGEEYKNEQKKSN